MNNFATQYKMFKHCIVPGVTLKKFHSVYNNCTVELPTKFENIVSYALRKMKIGCCLENAEIASLQSSLVLLHIT